jgi:hypothetical protein
MAGTDPLIGRSWAGGRWLIWPADEVRVDQLLVIEAETQVRAADAAVLREPNAAVTSKLACFDLAGGCFYETPIFRALLL